MGRCLALFCITVRPNTDLKLVPARSLAERAPREWPPATALGGYLPLLQAPVVPDQDQLKGPL